MGVDPTESEQIDAIVDQAEGWKRPTLARLRACTRRSDPSMQKEVKWRKPSRPMGVPVWACDGIVCIGETLKAAVGLTFPQGASVKCSTGFFNARPDSRTVRAIDFGEGDEGDEDALAPVGREAVRINRSARAGVRARS